MIFNDSDLDKLLKMAKLFSKIKDNLVVSVQHTTYHHIFKIKYSLDTGSKVCHQIKYRRKDQSKNLLLYELIIEKYYSNFYFHKVDVRSSDVTAIKSRLFATFFKLSSLENVSCCKLFIIF